MMPGQHAPLAEVDVGLSPEYDPEFERYYANLFTTEKSQSFGMTKKSLKCIRALGADL